MTTEVTTDQALNRRLAEWVGFWQKITGSSDYWHYPSKPNGKVCGWSYPSFTTSLDACFRWLVPKVELYLTNKGHRYEEISFGKENNEGFCFIVWWQNGDDYGCQVTDGRGEPALALCRAIEKLIDAEIRE